MSQTERGRVSRSPGRPPRVFRGLVTAVGPQARTGLGTSSASRVGSLGPQVAAQVSVTSWYICFQREKHLKFSETSPEDLPVVCA